MRPNIRLSVAGLATQFGDWISYFILPILIHNETNSFKAAALTLLPIALGSALGGFSIPKLERIIDARKILILSQVFGAVPILILLSQVVLKVQIPVFEIYAFALIQSLLKSIFEGAQDVCSKRMDDSNAHQALTLELLTGTFGARALGPLIAFLVINMDVSFVIPLGVDLASFIIAAVLCFGLPKGFVIQGKAPSVSALWSVLRKSENLLWITFIRSFALFICIVPSNFFLFEVSQTQYHVNLLHLPLFYSVIGIGAFIAAQSKLTAKYLISSITAMGVGASLLSALATYGFAIGVGLWVGTAMLLLKGYFNAIQIAGTRSLRRQYAGDHLADVIAVEAVLGQLTASILYATTYFMALHVSPTQGMRLAAFTYLAVAGIFALSRPGNLFGFQFKKKFSVVELK